MLRLGHYGAAMLAYAPVISVLDPGDLLTATAGFVLVLVAARLPDIDQRVPVVPHRGPTHTVWFGTILGPAFAWAVYSVLPATSRSLLVMVAVAPVIGVLSHLAADAITPAGVRPLWPLHERSVTLAIVRTENWIANRALFGLGLLALAAMANARLLAG